MNFNDFTLNIAEKAGKLILKYHKNGFEIEQKSDRDFVTTADKKSEEYIIDTIKKEFPSHGFLAEESEFKNASDLKQLLTSPYIWIIDPLDGTTNFTHGLPNVCVSIAVFKTQNRESGKNFKYLSGEIIFGAIYQPFTKEMFYAEKGKGAFLNDTIIRVSKAKKLKEAIIEHEAPLSRAEQNLDAYTALSNHTQGTRQLGSAAMGLSYLASGRLDAMVSFGLKPWDIAAGLLLVKEAGGNSTDSHGNLIDLFGQDLLASNGLLHKEMLKILN